MKSIGARRFLSAGASTLLANGFNFFTTFLFLHSFPPAEFGVFAMLTTLLTIANLVIGALIAQQMGYSLPRNPDGPIRLSAGRMYASMAALCTGMFLPFVFAILVYLNSDPVLILAGSAYLAASMYRAYSRHYFFAIRMPLPAVHQDVLFVCLAATGLGATAMALGLTGHLWLILLLYAAANLIAVSLVPPPRPARSLRILRRHLLAYRRQASRALWSFVTASLSTISLLSPNLVILSRGDLVKLAIVAAPGVMLAPLRLMIVMLQSTLRPEFSHLVAQRRHGELRRLYFASTGSAACLCALLLSVAYVAWPLIYTNIFSSGYEQTTVRETALLSIMVASITLIRFPGAMLLNAYNRFSCSAAAWTLIAPLVLLLAIRLSASAQIADILYAPLFGEIAIAVVELWVVIRLLGTQRSSAASLA